MTAGMIELANRRTAKEIVRSSDIDRHPRRRDDGGEDDAGDYEMGFILNAAGASMIRSGR